MKKIYRILVFIASLGFGSLGLFFYNLNLILIAILLMLLNNFMFSLEKIGERCILFFFNISFFTFLIGGYLNNFTEQDLWTAKFPHNIIFNTLLMIYVSLLSIFLGFVISKKNKLNLREVKINYSLDYVRKVSRTLFFLTYLFQIITSIEIIIFAQVNSYLSLYQSVFVSKFPSFFNNIAHMNVVFLYIFLATLPKKKDLKIPFIFYSIYLILSLLTGERGSFVTNIFVIIVYLLIREHISKNDNEKYLNKKLLFIIAPIFIGFLSMYNIIRNAGAIENFNLVEEIFRFFKDQGGSSNIISYVQVYSEQLYINNFNYTFGHIIDYFKDGAMWSLISGNTTESILHSNNLAATITYIVDPIYFSNGGGFGTQYIAEVYADFGYFGVVLYNILIGALLKKISAMFRSNWILFTLGLLVIDRLFFMPRDFALQWILSFCSITNWIAIISTYLIANYLYNKNINYRKKNI